MKLAFVLLVAPITLIAVPARAQEFGSGLVVQTAIPQASDRGNNVSVQERARPYYTATGISVGGVLFSPKVEVGVGATTNTYLTSDDPLSAPFLYQTAAASLSTQWSRHFFRLAASTTHREYVNESRRNENTWNVDAGARLDVHSSIKIDASVNATQSFENLFSTEAATGVAALSKYRREYGSIKSTYTEGRTRIFASVDHTRLDFSKVPLLEGGMLDQNFRDREITRLTAQLEYGRSPSVAYFAQVTGSAVNYDQPFSATQSAFDSKSIRLLAGVNVDIAGRWRGSVGAGYIIRHYDSADYKGRRGLAAEAQVELFLTPRLTFGVTGRRTIEDIAVGVPVPSFNTTGSFRADYELLRNMILSASTEYVRQGGGVTGYRAIAGTRYLASRRLTMRGQITYSRRNPNSLEEGRVEVSAVYQI